MDWPSPRTVAPAYLLEYKTMLKYKLPYILLKVVLNSRA